MIENIFFTHLHSDHILGFSDILMTGWVYHRQKPLNIFGPPGTINFVDSTIRSFEEDIKVRICLLTYAHCRDTFDKNDAFHVGILS